ncbi:oxidoreductase [Thermocrinis sp.]|uniref:NADH-quinone oxidoreductase subunit B family protein n=1 Tax=Thermocrinis sp. TaxID=2024383 RepID=UPI002FDD03A3
MGDRKLSVGIFKLSSCDGCQAVFFEVDMPFEVVYWQLGKSDSVFEDVDIAFVEGSVSTEEEREKLYEIREKSKLLVAIGACAVSGGIQALRNFGDFENVLRVYPEPNWLKVSEKSLPIKEVVKVDYEIPGCPINAQVLQDFINAIKHNRRPAVPNYPLCMQCKRLGYACVTDLKGLVCLGPITNAGCGALCPSVGRGCYGCFGPCEGANVKAFVSWLKGQGLYSREIFENENAYAEPIREVIQ